MKRVFTRKGIVLLAVLAIAAVAAVGAYAYYTSNQGSGTGTGTAGASTAWTVAPTAFSGGALLPGAGSQSGVAVVTNASSGHQYLATITATIAAPTHTGTVLAGDPAHACSAADFNLVGGTGWVVASDGQSATYAVGSDLAAAGSVTSASLAIEMLNKPYNQDSCQGAYPNVSYTVS